MAEPPVLKCLIFGRAPSLQQKEPKHQSKQRDRFHDTYDDKVVGRAFARFAERVGRGSGDFALEPRGQPDGKSAKMPTNRQSVAEAVPASKALRMKFISRKP